MRLNPFGFILIVIAAFVIWAVVSDEDDEISHENQDDISIRPIQKNASEEKQDNAIAIKDMEGDLPPVTKQDKPQTYTDSVTGIEFVFVKGGCFDMGNIFEGGLYQQVHKVCVDDFYIGKYEVTQKQWTDVMGNNPSSSKKGDDYPVDQVSWNDVQKFIRKIKQKTGKKYRLPTEAEWEYAARSRGKKEKWAGTSKESELGEYAWCIDNSFDIHPVGKKKPNRLFIYDMTGNVWEWCEDFFSKDYYANSSRDNPKGPSEGTHRVDRGGGWESYNLINRTFDRHNTLPDSANFALGFRLAMSP